VWSAEHQPRQSCNSRAETILDTRDRINTQHNWGQGAGGAGEVVVVGKGCGGDDDLGRGVRKAWYYLDFNIIKTVNKPKQTMYCIRKTCDSLTISNTLFACLFGVCRRTLL